MMQVHVCVMINKDKARNMYRNTECTPVWCDTWHCDDTNIVKGVSETAKDMPRTGGMSDAQTGMLCWMTHVQAAEADPATSSSRWQ